MSNIFISHSSKDNAFAQKVICHLKQIGHKSIFLDFDPNNGIPPGRHWEQELYNNLRVCQVVVILYSWNYSGSYWCFAEITHARALGKHIIPIKIDNCAVNGILSSIQVIDAASDLKDAFNRLESGLAATGINKDSWDPGRPPYPGLFAFTEKDAPVFFGREAETQRFLEAVNKFHSFGGPKFLLVLGSSGSGKSSLIRAGLIPQLRRNKSTWLILEPFRPLKQPFEELSKSLAACFHKHKSTRSWQGIYDLLFQDAKDSHSKAEALANLLVELNQLIGEENATTLLIIDQFEELFDHCNEKDENSLFLSYLDRFYPTDSLKFLIISTLRSDYLINFQKLGKFKGFDDIIVQSISTEGLKKAIVEPARVASLELEEGLADKVISDTATADALPLMAFTLRELWEQFGTDGRLTINGYKTKLRGLEGSVARVAEAVLVSYISEKYNGKIITLENGEKSAQLDGAIENQLRVAFISMVRIDEESRFTKIPANSNEMPSRISDLLERFVKARLLTKYTKDGIVIIEVAHEAIFRTWTRLVNWLNEDRNFFIWRKRLNTNILEWERSNRDKSELLRGPSLSEALDWHNHNKAGKFQLKTEEIAFIESSYQESEKLRLKKRQNNIITITVLVLVVILISLFSLEIYKNNIETKKQLVRNLWDNSQTARIKEDYLSALHFTSSLINISNDRDLKETALLDIGSSLPQLNLINVLSHESYVNTAVFSPNGKWLLTASDDKTARLFDASTGKQILPSMRHEDHVENAVFSPDGKRILTISWDKTARQWDVISGKQIGPSMKHQWYISSFVFSPDGKTIVTASGDKLISFWDVYSGKRIGPSIEPRRYINMVQFSPDGKWILTGSMDRTARLWDVVTGKQIGPAMKHEDEVNSAVFSPNGKWILTTSNDNTARLWEVVTGKQIGPSMEHLDWVYSAVFSANSKLIVTTSKDKTARLWEVATGKQIGDPMRHEDGITSAVFSPDGEWILTGSSDKTSRLWDRNSTRQFGPSFRHEGTVNSALFSPNGKRVLTAGADNTARLWNIAIVKPSVIMIRHNEAVMGAVFGPDNRRILTFSSDNIAHLVQISNGARIVHDFKHDNLINSVEFSPDGKWVLTSSWDSTARLWDAATGKQMDSSMKHGDKVISAVFSADGKFILTASEDNTACLWKSGTGKKLGPSMRHKNAVFGAVFSPNGKWILTASGDSTACLWDVVTGKQTGRAMKHEDEVNSAVFSPDGKWIITASNDKTARLWDAASGQQIGPSMKHGDAVNSAVFSPDGKFILTTSSDNTARLWRAATGRQLGPSMWHKSAVFSAVFSPDGKWILSAGNDNTARLWDVKSYRQIGPNMEHGNYISSAVFSPDSKWILTSGGDRTVNLWDTSTDLDIPVDLFRMQAMAVTGTQIDEKSNDIHCISKAEWMKLKDHYYIQAKEHYKECKYPEHNLWRNFYPKEADNLRPYHNLQ